MKNVEFCRKTSKFLPKRCIFIFCIFYLNEKELNQQVCHMVTHKKKKKKKEKKKTQRERERQRERDRERERKRERERDREREREREKSKNIIQLQKRF